MRIFHINTTLGYNAPGRLVAALVQGAAAAGNDAAAAYDRYESMPAVNALPIGTAPGRIAHALLTRLLDVHGHASHGATRRLLRALDQFQPDLVHLHNLHGYWLNVPELMHFLARRRMPVVWTLHDFLPLTGHCAFPDQAGCNRWLTGCHDCPQLRQYPASWGADRSRRNWAERRAWLRGLHNPQLVAVSRWQRGLIATALADSITCEAIHNPVDTEIFNPSAGCPEPKLVLGAASVWDVRKGLDRFAELRHCLPDDYRIALAGLTPAQARSLPRGIEAVPRLDTQAAMAGFLARGAVFVNLSRAETLGMVNLEARCCGTPVATLAAGGARETVAPDSGFIIDRYNPEAVAEAVMKAAGTAATDRRAIAARAAEECSPQKAIDAYMAIYRRIL